jgi:hypothetical protein
MSAYEKILIWNDGASRDPMSDPDTNDNVILLGLNCDVAWKSDAVIEVLKIVDPYGKKIAVMYLSDVEADAGPVVDLALYVADDLPQMVASEKIPIDRMTDDALAIASESLPNIFRDEARRRLEKRDSEHRLEARSSTPIPLEPDTGDSPSF